MKLIEPVKETPPVATATVTAKKHEDPVRKSKREKAAKAVKSKAKGKAKGKSEKKGKLRTGRFTYFPDKTITRSWRITAKMDDTLRDAGERIKDKTREDPDTGKPGRAVGATDVLEALTRLYAPSLTMDDINKAMVKR